MSLLSDCPPSPSREIPAAAIFWNAVWRAVLLTFGLLLLAVGVVGALLPGHLGIPLLVLGLILVLRTSRPARRRFIHLQRRHPKVVFPIRRLLRREPEVLPVMYQQILRLERRLTPSHLRVCRRLRRRLFRRARPTADPILGAPAQ